MTETTEVTSDAKFCKDCGATFGDGDDGRYKSCAVCRKGGPAVEDAPAVAAAPAPPIEEGVEAVTLDVKRYIPKKPKHRNLYWCGATKDSPIFSVALGGIEFPKTEGQVRDGDAGQFFVDHVRDGKTHRLTDIQVELIKEHAANKVVRNWRSDTIIEIHKTHEVYQGDVLSMSGSNMAEYDAQEGDIPLGCFVYMIKVRSKNDRPFDDSNPPPTMVARTPDMKPL